MAYAFQQYNAGKGPRSHRIVSAEIQLKQLRGLWHALGVYLNHVKQRTQYLKVTHDGRGGTKAKGAGRR